MNFSVLMSIYKKESVEHFRQALDSIIDQTLPPTEIVIVKDGELTKALNEVCDDYKNKYLNLFKFVQLNENKGLGVALQTGLQYCQYDIIARMDTDDISKPNRFARQMAEFEKDTQLSIIGTTIEEFSMTPFVIDSIRQVPQSNEDIKQYAKMRNPFNHMTVMFKKQAIMDVGNYQPFYLNEDYYLWYRLLNNGYKAKNLKESLVFARVDKNMFQRRGGKQYFLQEIKLQNIFYKNKFINEYEYFRNIGMRMVIRLVPNVVREFFYRKCMRKSKESW